MTGQVVAAILLILAGTALDVPIVMALGFFTLVLEMIREVWARYGLRDVTYDRRLATDRTTWGDEIPLTIEVWNRKGLPLAWLRAEDEATDGVVVREQALVEGVDGGVLRNLWTLAPWERVTRYFHVGAERRGVFLLGPVTLAVGDLVAREAATEGRPATTKFLVRPRTVATPELERPERWGGVERVRAGLTEDPARFAGLRPYAPGDPIRRIHQRSSARLGRPVTKRFEPSRDREVLIALDVQTAHGPAWDLAFDDETVEQLFVVAASVARSLAAEHAMFGIAAVGYSGAETQLAHIPVSAASGQAERVLDLLARLSSHASAPFERLLLFVQRVARPGTTVLVLTARDPSPFVAHLRRIERSGSRVVVLACGPKAADDAARARAFGFAARSARLDGPWRTAETLVVAR